MLSNLQLWQLTDSVLIWCCRYQLAYRVPDLELDLFAIYVNHARPKLDANGQVMDRLKAFICELQKQARLSNACVARAVGLN